MLIGSLKIDGVEIQKIRIPENTKEIRYGQYLDYAMIKNDIDQWLIAQVNAGRDYKNQYKVKLSQAASVIYEVKPETLRRIQHDGIDFLDAAWTIADRIITDFRPIINSGKFSVEGQWYEIPLINQAVFRGTNNLPTMTFQQLTEIAETERILQDQIERIDKDQKEFKEKNGTLISKAMQKSYQTFENTMKKIALCIHSPKEIPVDDSFDMWLETKMKKLRNISMYDALNTIFFLKGIPIKYGISIDLDSISNILKSRNIEMNQMNNIRNESEILKPEEKEFTI